MTSLPPLKNPSLPSLAGVGALHGAPPSSPSTRAADAAMRSAEALQEKRTGLFDGLKKAAVAALVGVTLLSSVAPAHADTTAQAAPQTSSWFEAAPPTGPPSARALLGLDTHLAPGGALQAAVDSAQLSAQQKAIDAATRTALDAFTTKVTQILHKDAASLAAAAAAGRLSTSSSTTTPQQQQALEAALKDLVQQVPVGAFAPAVQAPIQAATSLALRQLGHDDVDVSTMSLRDLEKLTGDAASARANELVKTLRHDHPTAFWSAAAAVTAGGVALGYTQGTDALRALGLKPEFSTTIARGERGSTRLQVGLDAGPRFTDPRTTVGVTSEHTTAAGTLLRGGLQARLQGTRLDEVGATGALRTPEGFSADVAVRLDGRGQPFDARLSARQAFTHTIAGGGAGTAWATAQWSNGTHGTTASSSVAAGLDVTHGAWTSSLSAHHSFADGRFTSTLSTGRSFVLDGGHRLDVAVRASHDSRGATGVGVGATLRF
jgi:hypothetical protein